MPDLSAVYPGHWSHPFRRSVGHNYAMTDGAAGFMVLVVEDEPLIGMDIEYAVERLGHEVVGPIAELDKALDLAADALLDCAILDVNIRGGLSYPVADILLNRGLPVLLLSGYSERTLPERLHDVAS